MGRTFSHLLRGNRLILLTGTCCALALGTLLWPSSPSRSSNSSQGTTPGAPTESPITSLATTPTALAPLLAIKSPSPTTIPQLCRYARQQSEDTAVCSNAGILRAGFQGWSYWSSTQYNSTAAWYQRMNDGVQDGVGGTKTISVWTRPVREFGPIVLQES